MSLAVLYSCALVSMDAPKVVAETRLANALTSFTIVGLPEVEEKKAKIECELPCSQHNLRFQRDVVL